MRSTAVLALALSANALVAPVAARTTTIV